MSEEMFKLEPWEFDQSPIGWRSIEKTQGYEEASEAIKEYISRNKEKITNQDKSKHTVSLETMYFHLGQELASSGKLHYQEAITYFNKSYKESDCWNAYVDATIGFLKNDFQKIEDAIKRASNSKEEDKRSANLNIINNFINEMNNGRNNYEKAYSLSRSETHS